MTHETYIMWFILILVNLVPTSSITTEETLQTRQLKLLVLLPRWEGDEKLPFGEEMCGEAVLSALKHIEDDQLLPGWDVKADYADTGCDRVQGIGVAYDKLHESNYHAIIGPQCSPVCLLINRLATYLDIPVFTGICQSVEMTDKDEFKTLTRFLASFEMTGFALMTILSNFNWDHIGVIIVGRVDPIWFLTRQGVDYAAEKSNVTVALSTLLNENDPDMDLEQTLLKTAAVSRIIVLGMYGGTFRQTLILAHKHGLLNGEYIFLAVYYYKQKRVFGNFEWKQGDGYDDIIKEAYKFVFWLSYYVRDDTEMYKKFIEAIKKGSRENFGYTYEEDEEVPYPCATLYEAVYLLSVATNETLQEYGSLMLRNGTRLSRRLWGRSFHEFSLTGDLYLNSNGDREQAYMISHMQDAESGIIEVIGNYFSNGQVLDFFVDAIVWHTEDGSIPVDEPACGFQGEICFQDQLSKIVGIFCGALVFVVATATIVIGGIYRHQKWQRALADMTWKIDPSDIVQNNGVDKSSMFSHLSLRSGTERSIVGHQDHFISTALYKGQMTCVKRYQNAPAINLTDNTFLVKMKHLHDLHHANLARFVGMTIDTRERYILTEYAVKGSLQDLLENDDIQLDWHFKCSILNDIVQGLSFLHGSFLRCHRNLKSANCVVDSRFVVKLTDFGVDEIIPPPKRKAKDLLWTAPEILRSENRIAPSKETDIYSLGIVMQEVLVREGAFFIKDRYLDPEEIIAIIMNENAPVLRPSLPLSDYPSSVIMLVDRCWAEVPTDRPTLSEVSRTIRELGGQSNIMDNLLGRMEQYANNLEDIVQERTGQYLEEKKKAESLLHRLLPRSIADQLQTQGQVSPETYDSVTIYFSDIVGFTSLCSESTPMQVVALLNDLYTLFDKIIASYDVYKVETIGDAYMAVSGLPERNTEHASQIALMALALLRGLDMFKVPHRDDYKLKLRIGIHSGSCAAGVVGVMMPRYCLFGDTVNTASRMESNGEALKIHISESTYSHLNQHRGFDMACRGKVSVKGKAEMITYWLLAGPDDTN